jgi:predicted pyridoxine 5'-phosphate oxidase superfamily flavin-nucleotide-binding protein
MESLPKEVLQAWEDREGPIVFTTVDTQGVPNAIYATCVRCVADDKIAVADNYFNKTRANIRAGSRGSILFITREGTSYQVKGSVDYLVDGPIYDVMRECLDAEFPVHAVAVVTADEVYRGGDQLA